MNILRENKTATLAIVLALITTLIAGCATSGSGMAKGDEDCSTMKSAGAGALLGGLLGAALGGKNNVAKGAAAGALAGGLACFAMNYHSKQVRTAKEVNNEYVTENEKLPPEPIPKMPSLGCTTSPVPVTNSVWRGSATSIIASRRRSTRSVPAR